MTIQERITKTYLVPVVVIKDPAHALPAAKAMLAGGVDMMEITLRTEHGIGAIKEVSEACPDMCVGAGTVVDLAGCKAAIEAGAKFIVSPGFDEEVVKYCIEKGVDVLPGCVTPSEIMAAMKLGLKVVKFFPANVYGGIKAIKSLAGPFGSMKFVPTGGVGASNLGDYVDKTVFAIGGGWLCDPKAMAAGDYQSITDACAAAVAVVAEKRG